MDFLQLANLRPGQPMSALAGAIGETWTPPTYNDLGSVRLAKKNEKKFSARLDINLRIGEVNFSIGFPENHRIEGIFLGMRLEKALLARPHLTRHMQDPCETTGQQVLIDSSELAYDIFVYANDISICKIALRSRVAVYPAFEPADPNLRKAFDFWPAASRLLPNMDRGAEWANGWTFGLPPGIQARHWPLHPECGYPLRHIFTLRLPQEYRVKGDDRVALSLFAGDMGEDAPQLEEFKADKVEHHPHEYSMEDLICRKYVAIWLSEAEFNAPLCQPPMMEDQLDLSDYCETQWATKGYAATFEAPRGFDGNRLQWPSGAAGADLACAFPITIAIRDGDPNVGKPPRAADEDEEGDENEDAYIPIFSDMGEELDLQRFHHAPHANHLGGTMYGGEWNMKFGPYYLEFHEDLAASNLAGGELQIDLKRMQLNWSH